MRTAEIKRKTAETDIAVKLNIDGSGNAAVSTGVGFLDHMLTLFAKHGRFDLDVKCKGDLNVDFHHTVEDVAICIGKAFGQALGDKTGITRYGSVILPMDEALVLCALDISGRTFLALDLGIRAKRIGDFDVELIEEFFHGFTRACPVTLHIKKLDGRNSHHIAEAAFKAFGRTLCAACALDERLGGRIPSTKGIL
ncbi:MAG: imidazoleglycerol-phosphate dehydratase HisB [Clostridia bacterium]|nr:imidazoleglycerol-phosphate dehydratase HisB [Clostridia bacterium]